jgi:hypothetical protein
MTSFDEWASEEESAPSTTPAAKVFNDTDFMEAESSIVKELTSVSVKEAVEAQKFEEEVKL